MECKFVSSLEKCFLDQTPADFAEVTQLRMYQNERAAIQFLAYEPAEAERAGHFLRFVLEGEAAPYAHVRTVESVPNYFPGNGTPATDLEKDPTFLRVTPGLYPDLLLPLTHHGSIPVINQQLHPVMITIDPRGALAAGKYPMTVRLLKDGETVAEKSFELEIYPVSLPEQDTIVTNWFHADCLADYYEVEPLSDRHFEICENFIRTAVENGINMLLTPVFTPPLDTAVGGERTTVQLVGVKREGGVYSFDFSLLDRWIAMCDRCGIQYLEISHLFSQWGAYHAPKIMATVDGEYKRLFGWETDAAGEEYVTFLRTFLKALTAHLEALGRRETTYFHISDEPGEQHLTQYKTNKANIGDLLEGWKILDALSHVEFYREGLMDTPVPVSSKIEDFMKEQIAERWVYYCCSPWIGASNRFLGMHLGRARSLGMQMYCYGIRGFLHWGYNFYNNQNSEDVANPYLNASAGYWDVGGGDAFCVYPGRKGMPLESIRLLAMRQAFDDIRVMKLCEQLCGREKTLQTVQDLVGKVDFDHCVNDAAVFTKLRDALDTLILAAQ